MRNRKQHPDPRRIAASIREAQRLSRELHDGRIGPSTREYTHGRRDPAAYSHVSIFSFFESWAHFLEAAGLRHEGRGYYAGTRQPAGNGRDYGDGGGLPIGRVRYERTYDPMRHGWRWMLRMEVR